MGEALNILLRQIMVGEGAVFGGSPARMSVATRPVIPEGFSPEPASVSLAGCSISCSVSGVNTFFEAVADYGGVSWRR